MEVIRIIDLSLFIDLLLIYLFIHIWKNRVKGEWSTRLFLAIIAMLIFNNSLELISWLFNRRIVPFARIGNYVTTSILLAANSLPAVIWVTYIDYKLFRNIKKTFSHVKYYLIPFYISVILVVVNIPTEIVFKIDQNNFYSRNFGMYMIVALSFSLIITLFVVSRRYKKHIDGRVLESIFWFMLIPIVASIIQIFYYGIPLIWPAFSFAILITFNLIEKESSFKDPLTGLHTRNQFENRLQYMLKRRHVFSMIMIDMNDFKKINDIYGHNEGDNALLAVTAILLHETKSYDMVCRYGGDEFMLLIESDKERAYTKVIKRIDKAISNYNKKEIVPYMLSMSFGGLFLKNDTTQNILDIFSEVDRLMYIDKNKRKERKLNS